MHTKFCSKNQEGRQHSEDLGVDEKIIMKLILGWKDVDWINLAQDRDPWRAVVNTVMNFLVP
jgi:hypothetical protein